MKNELISLAKQRRSIYALGKNVSFTNEEISTLVKDTIKNLPTAFNNQTTRAIITFGESHDKVWNIVLARLRKEVKDDDAFAKTTAKTLLTLMWSMLTKSKHHYMLITSMIGQSRVWELLISLSGLP